LPPDPLRRRAIGGVADRADVGAAGAVDRRPVLACRGNKAPARFVSCDVTTTDLTAEQFNDTINGNDIVLVDFWASWCGPCRAFAPTFQAASEKHPDVVFAKVDTEAEQQLAAAAEIRSIPTLMAFKKGKLLFNQPGALPPAALEDLLQQVKAFDVEAAEAAAEPKDV
jgi:thioredoxin reductase (NADPH)